MKRKALSLLLCLSMTAAALTACGGTSSTAPAGGDTPASQAEGGDTPASQAEGGDQTAAPAEGGGQLVYWSMWSEDEPQAKVIKAAIEKYTADTGVAVDVQFKGRSGQREGLQPALDAKQTIDLFDEDVNRVNGAWGKYLLDLEDLAKDYEGAHGNKTLFAIARNAYGQANGGDNTLHSIPYQPSIFGFFYNKTLFDQAGIELEPMNWAEFDDVCQKLLDAGITPITADDAYMTSFIGTHLARYLGQDGVKSLVLGEEYNGVTVNWDEPQVLSAAESFSDFASKGYFSKNISTNTYPVGQNQEFAPGDAAIVICGSWLPNEAKASVASDLEWGYFNYPSVPGGKDDNTANNIANQVLAINKDSAMAKEAFELITYITTGEFDQKMTVDALCIPTDTANGDAWPAELESVKDDFDKTVTYYDWAAGVENNNDLTPTISSKSIELAAGKIDAATFVAELKKAAGQ